MFGLHFDGCKDRLLTCLIMILSAGLIDACTADDSHDTSAPDTGNKDKTEISICATVKDNTRVNDDAFENGDAVGLYVVNRLDGVLRVSLKATGNQVDNMRFTYTGNWIPDRAVYWGEYTADFYLYYPYMESIANPSAVRMTVRTDQSTRAGYKASEALIGNALDKSPDATPVSIFMSHLWSKVCVKLKAGTGFTDTELGNSDVSVKINGVKTEADVNLQTADVTAVGNERSVSMWAIGGMYQAMIVPQEVEGDDLITIKVGGTEYAFSKPFTFRSGTCHTFTLTLSKTGTGINIGITGWEIDGTDHGGVAE